MQIKYALSQKKDLFTAYEIKENVDLIFVFYYFCSTISIVEIV